MSVGAYPPPPRPARLATGVRALAAVLVPARSWLDGAWWVPVAPGLTLPQVAGGLATAVALVAAVADARRWSPGTRALLGAVGVLVAVGALRTTDPKDAASNALHLLGPFAVWALARAAADPGLVVGWERAAWLPVGASLAALAAGTSSEVVLDGWPRLLGFYGNVHAHAAAMAVITASAGLGVLSGRRTAAPLALAAATCLAATFVRGGVVFVVVALLAAAPRSRAARLAAALVVVGSLGLVSARWADLWSLATGVAPDGGWGALGSHRLTIWRESTAAFLREPPVTLLLGRGLGGQLGLHRHLDPHHELLSLWFQLGPAGPALWLLAWLGAFRAARGGAVNPARGLLAGALALALVGNDVLYRATLAWWVAGVAGLAAGVRPGASAEASAEAGPRRSGAAADPPPSA